MHVMAVADVNWLLSALAQATAALIAIVGGLLVSRYVTLHAEQQARAAASRTWFGVSGKLGKRLLRHAPTWTRITSRTHSTTIACSRRSSTVS